MGFVLNLCERDAHSAVKRERERERERERDAELWRAGEQRVQVKAGARGERSQVNRACDFERWTSFQAYILEKGKKKHKRVKGKLVV